MLSDKTWSTQAVARLFLAVLGSFCFGIILAGIVESLQLGRSNEQRRFIQMVVAGVSFQGAALVWVHVFLMESNLSWREAFGFGQPNRMHVVVFGLLAGVLFLPLAWGLQQASDWAIKAVFNQDAAPQDLVQELLRPGISVGQKVFFGVLAIVIAPIAEETLFRGVLYPTLKRTGYPKLALVATSLFFGAFHLNAVSFVPLTLFGALLILLYEETGNLLAPILTHSVFNTVNFLVLIFQEQIGRFLDLK